MASLYRLVASLLLALFASSAWSTTGFVISNATAFSGAVTGNYFSTNTAACDEYVAGAATLIVNQGACTGAKSVSLTSCPSPSVGTPETGGISFSWQGRQYGQAGDACVQFSATGTFSVTAVNDPPENEVNACASKAGVSAGRFDFDTGILASSTGPAMTSKYICDASCLLKMEPDIAYGAGPYTGTGADTWWQAGPSRWTGDACVAGSGDGNSAGAPKPGGDGELPAGTTPCPAGKVPGEFNGTTICVTPGVDQPVVTTTTDQKTVNNPDGSITTTTTTTTTTCSGSGECTTSTTVNTINQSTPSGTATTSTTTTSGTCTSTAGCGMGAQSGFGGSCDTAFQ